MGRKSTGSDLMVLKWAGSPQVPILPGPKGLGAQAFQAHGPNGPEVHRFQSFSISRFTGHTRMLGPSVFPDSQALKKLGPSVFPDSQVKKSSFETQNGLSRTDFKSESTPKYILDIP